MPLLTNRQETPLEALQGHPPSCSVKVRLANHRLARLLLRSSNTPYISIVLLVCGIFLSIFGNFFFLCGFQNLLYCPIFWSFYLLLVQIVRKSLVSIIALVQPFMQSCSFVQQPFLSDNPFFEWTSSTQPYFYHSTDFWSVELPHLPLSYTWELFASPISATYSFMQKPFLSYYPFLSEPIQCEPFSIIPHIWNMFYTSSLSYIWEFIFISNSLSIIYFIISMLSNT